MRTDKVYTIIRHPSGEGWTFSSARRPHSWLARLISRPTVFDVLLYLNSQGVPWQNIVWPLTTPPRSDILITDQISADE
jgi:hypothetical protein